MITPAEFQRQADGITLETLLESGGTKWSGGGGKIGAWVAEMDFGTAPAVTKALHASIDDAAFGYLPPKFAAGLKQATADFYASKFGWSIEPSDVRQVPDVIAALELALEHHSKPGSKIIVPTPTYFPFLMRPPQMGREVIEVPMIERDGRHAFDLDRLEQAFANGGNLLVLCNPFNPLGRVFDHDELIEVSELVDRCNGRVFADEIWAPLTFRDKRHIPYASVNNVAAGHTITAISASKAWNLPGLKCAQIILSNDADRKIWDRIGYFASHGTANPGVIANTVAYTAGGDWLAALVAYLDNNRRSLSDLVAEHLPGVRYNQPEGTYIAWLDFTDTPLAEGPAEFFRENAAVQISDGITCGKGFDGFGRFIFATPRHVMVTAFERMGAAFKTTG